MSTPRLLLCGVPVFAALVVGEEPSLVNEVILLAATQDVRSVVDSLELHSNALAPAASVNTEDGIAVAHVCIHENIIGECLVECEEYLLVVDIHAVENIDIVVDELGHNSDECATRLIGEFGAAFNRLLEFFVSISEALGELRAHYGGIIPNNTHILLICLLVCLVRLFLMLFERGEVGKLLLTFLDEFVIVLAVGLERDFIHRICLLLGAYSYNLI